jgi:hypothetical protein
MLCCCVAKTCDKHTAQEHPERKVLLHSVKTNIKAVLGVIFPYSLNLILMGISKSLYSWLGLGKVEGSAAPFLFCLHFGG